MFTRAKFKNQEHDELIGMLDDLCLMVVHVKDGLDDSKTKVHGTRFLVLNRWRKEKEHNNDGKNSENYGKSSQTANLFRPWEKFSNNMS